MESQQTVPLVDRNNQRDMVEAILSQLHICDQADMVDSHQLTLLHEWDCRYQLDRKPALRFPYNNGQADKRVKNLDNQLYPQDSNNQLDNFDSLIEKLVRD